MFNSKETTPILRDDQILSVYVLRAGFCRLAISRRQAGDVLTLTVTFDSKKTTPILRDNEILSVEIFLYRTIHAIFFDCSHERCRIIATLNTNDSSPIVCRHVLDNFDIIPGSHTFRETPILIVKKPNPQTKVVLNNFVSYSTRRIRMQLAPFREHIAADNNEPIN